MIGKTARVPHMIIKSKFSSECPHLHKMKVREPELIYDLKEKNAEDGLVTLVTESCPNILQEN